MAPTSPNVNESTADATLSVGGPGRRILGLDPGLRVTGYGVIDPGVPTPRLVEAGVLRVPASLPLPARLQHLYRNVQQLLQEHRPVAVAMEELFSHVAYPRTALLMAHARGAICLAVEDAGIPLASYLPTRVKKSATGSGGATKQQMQLAIQMQFRLAKAPTPPDVADALAVALCHFHAERSAIGPSAAGRAS